MLKQPSKLENLVVRASTVLILCTLLLKEASQNCLAVGLPLVSSSKKAPLSVPSYEKMTEGDGPSTNDVADTLFVAPNVVAPKVNQDGANLPSSLRPLTLHEEESIDQAQVTSTGDSTADSGVLKSTVSATDYVAKPGDSKEMQTKSVKGSPDSKTLVKQASKVGLGPVQLIESEAETTKKVETILTAEQMELNDLWESTLTRSQDIQFIIQKLQPTSSDAHLSTILTRMLSTAAFGGLGAMSMMSPNPGMYAATSAGGSMLSQVLGMKEKGDAKRAKLSQEEELMMFKMVRDTCDKLVNSYRDYKKTSTSLERACQDLQDLKAMVSEAHAGQDAAKQIEMEYTLRKQQRDIDSALEDTRRHRQGLVDLAGSEAVDKLDRQLAEEKNQVQQVQETPANDGATQLDVATNAAADEQVAPAGQITNEQANCQPKTEKSAINDTDPNKKTTASSESSPQS